MIAKSESGAKGKEIGKNSFSIKIPLLLTINSENLPHATRTQYASGKKFKKGPTRVREQSM
jgi:hypothetical protein